MQCDGGMPTHVEGTRGKGEMTELQPLQSLNRRQGFDLEETWDQTQNLAPPISHASQDQKVSSAGYSPEVALRDSSQAVEAFAGISEPPLLRGTPELSFSIEGGDNSTGEHGHSGSSQEVPIIYSGRSTAERHRSGIAAGEIVYRILLHAAHALNMFGRVFRDLCLYSEAHGGSIQGVGKRKVGLVRVLYQRR